MYVRVTWAQALDKLVYVSLGDAFHVMFLCCDFIGTYIPFVNVHYYLQCLGAGQEVVLESFSEDMFAAETQAAYFISPTNTKPGMKWIGCWIY